MMHRQKDLQSILAPKTAKDINCQRQQINVYEPVDNNSLFISFQTKYNYCRYTFRIQINFFNIGLHQILIHIFRCTYGANFNANCDYVDSKYNISKMFIPASIIALYLYLQQIITNYLSLKKRKINAHTSRRIISRISSKILSMTLRQPFRFFSIKSHWGSMLSVPWVIV